MPKEPSLTTPDDADTSGQDMQPERHDSDDSDEPGAAADVPARAHGPLSWEGLGDSMLMLMLMQAVNAGNAAAMNALQAACNAEYAEIIPSSTAWPKQPIPAMLDDTERSDPSELMASVGDLHWDAQGWLDQLLKGLWLFAPVGSLQPMVQNLHTWGWNLDARDSRGQTVLMLASQQGHRDAVKVLLKAEADLHVTNLAKHNALMLAAAQDQPKIVQLLVYAAMPSADTASEDDADFSAHFRDPKDFNGMGLTYLMSELCKGKVDAMHAAQIANKFDVPMSYAYFRITQAAAGGKAGNGLDETYAQAWDAENAVLCGLETTTDL